MSQTLNSKQVSQTQQKRTYLCKCVVSIVLLVLKNAMKTCSTNKCLKKENKISKKCSIQGQTISFFLSGKGEWGEGQGKGRQFSGA